MAMQREDFLKALGSKGDTEPPLTLAGQTIGLLTVLHYAGSKGGKGALWDCQCQCGAIVRERGTDLRRAQRNGLLVGCATCRTAAQDAPGEKKDMPMEPEFTLENVTIDIMGERVAYAYVRLGPVRLLAILTAKGDLSIHQLEDAEVRFRIASAMRKDVLTQLAEQWERIEKADRKRLDRKTDGYREEGCPTN
jgi:hypothetical protein